MKVLDNGVTIEQIADQHGRDRHERHLQQEKRLTALGSLLAPDDRSGS
jgi:hypothetical protein